MNQEKTLAAVVVFLLSTATTAALDDCPASFFRRLRSEAAGIRSSHGSRESAYSKHWKEFHLVDAV